jgi:polysaccharide pyruvyl transferase WcaK-like protein
MDRQRIGVLTFHKCINYGSYWQARCLVEGLRAQGHEVELVDHGCERVARAELRCAFQPTLPQRSTRGAMREYALKVRRFREAIASLPLSSAVSLHHPEALPRYDTVVVGSDEVWNLSHPWYGGVPMFYGAGLNGVRRVAYAGSFGSYSCHWGLGEYWADQLKRFDALSVRDDNSYWLVRGSTGREPAFVLDPCLQFPEAARLPAEPAEEPYAVVYGYGFPAWLIESVKRWAAASGVRLRSVGYYNGFADEQVLSAGPLQFARLLAGARAVVTNFFHGCVFALLSGKPFAATASEYRHNKLRGLVDTLGASDRLVDEARPRREIARLLAEPLPSHIERRIAEARGASAEYLHAALA